MTIDRQTLEDLEFTTLRNWLQAYAIGPTAHKRLGELSPIRGKSKIKIALKQVNELKNIRTEGEVFPHLDFEELNSEIKLLPIKNAAIQLEGFMRILYASQVVNRLIYFFDKREEDYPLLAKTLEHTYFTDEIIKAIEMVFDKHGKVKDDASPELLEIRTSLKSVKKQINRNFDKEARKLMKDNILGDTKETFINDRRVLTVLSNHKRKISGSVVGSSNTGSLTYIEPQVNIALNNEFELLQDDERKEIFKILQVLKKDLLNHLELIKEYQNVLTEFDFINSKTKLALALDCNLPSIMD
jgi:DNA mismatch repair protein MutS2